MNTDVANILPPSYAKHPRMSAVVFEKACDLARAVWDDSRLRPGRKESYVLELWDGLNELMASAEQKDE